MIAPSGHFNLAGWGVSSYPGEVLADAPIGYWRLGVAGGVGALSGTGAFQFDAFQQAQAATTMYDSSGFGRDGTFSAMGIGTDAAAVAIGANDTATKFTSVPAAFSRPSSTISFVDVTVVGPSPHQAVADVTADDNTSYVQFVQANATGGTNLALFMGAVADPAASTGHVIRVRGTRVDANSNTTIQLDQGDPNSGGKIIVPATALPFTASAGMTAYTDIDITLTAAQADSITDYSALRVGIVSKNTLSQCRITQIYFMTPAVNGTGTIPDASWMQTNAVSFEVWIRPDSVASGTIMRRSAASALSLVSGQARWLVKDVNNVDTIVLGGTIVAGQPYHIVGAYDHTQGLMTLTVNNVSVGTPTRVPNAAPIATVSTFALGSIAGNSDFFNGIIDEAAWYPKLLTAARTSVHFNKGSKAQAVFGRVTTWDLRGQVTDPLATTWALRSELPKAITTTWNTDGEAVTVPIVNVGTPTRSKLSRVAGADAADVTFTSDTAFAEYQVRVVPLDTATVTAGTLLESGLMSGVANTSYTLTITDDELVTAAAAEGSNTLKVFVKTSGGTWST